METNVRTTMVRNKSRDSLRPSSLWLLADRCWLTLFINMADGSRSFIIIIILFISGLKIIEEDSANSGSLYRLHLRSFDSGTLIFSWFGEFLLL